MWVAKIKISGEKALLGSRTKKYQVTLAVYPVSFYEQKEGIYAYFVGFLFGEDQNKRKFIQELKKNKKVLHIETTANFFIGQIIESPEFKKVYNPKIIHLKPIVIKENGDEIWSVGCWNRNELMELVNLLEQTHQGELLKIQEERITDFSIMSMQPELTTKQKKAIELAVRTGYYKYPRKIELKKLAQMMGISYSTFQAHLRKAEQKLLPFIFELSQ